MTSTIAESYSREHLLQLREIFRLEREIRYLAATGIPQLPDIHNNIQLKYSM